MKFSVFVLLVFFNLNTLFSQNTSKNDLGAWYMYFYTTKFTNSSFGLQGDVQFRNFNGFGDLEQLLIRSGISYNPKNTNISFILGAANITTGTIGESNVTTNENRIYQEIIMPTKVGERFYFTNRFRYEQRFVENQDFRSRFRYALLLNTPLNKKTLSKNAVYLALYNEIFINGEKNIGNNKTVSVFDRNRFYTGLGYGITDKIRVQVGFMNQSTELQGKDQLQFSLHHNF